MSGEAGPLLAAGAVVWRPRPAAPESNDGGVEICVIHRPKYDDWSLPKGKIDPGEHPATTAVREVLEETGHRIALGPPLPDQRYDIGDRTKLVHYWAASADDTAAPWRATDEVDEVDFLPTELVLARLSHPLDVQLVRTFLTREIRTTPLVLLRHTDVARRSSWTGRDARRPLSKRGKAAAKELSPVLAAYGITRVVTSDATRCRDSVRHVAKRAGVKLEKEPAFSEEGHAGASERAGQLVRKLMADGAPTVICSHRPVLPVLLSAAMEQATCEIPEVKLPAGGFHVLHHRDGIVVAIETHQVPHAPAP